MRKKRKRVEEANPLILTIHEEWAYANGYQAQAPSRKLRQNVARYNASDYRESSNKQQAS
jgi:hypothetical protein